MSTDYRALCSELVALLECFGSTFNIPIEAPVVTRARAALAQPEPVAPTDEELPMPAAIRDMPEQQQRWYALGWRAALARYGTPANQPVPVSERLPEPEDCDSEGKCWVECPAFVDDGDHGSIAYNPSWKLCRCTPSVVYDDTRWLPANALPTPEATS
jgi:hypothetical protein